VRDHEKREQTPNQLCVAVLGGVWIGAGEEDKRGDGPGRAQLLEGREGRERCHRRRRLSSSPSFGHASPDHHTQCDPLLPSLALDQARPFFLGFLCGEFRAKEAVQHEETERLPLRRHPFDGSEW
jgi:hypothetical protein